MIELSDVRLKKAVPKEDFYLLIDRMEFRKEDFNRLCDSISQAYAAALKYNNHLVLAQAVAMTVDGKQLLLSEDHSCSICGYNFPSLTPQFFSFNSPSGACSNCKGFGNTLDIDRNKVIPRPELSICEGAIEPFEKPSGRTAYRKMTAFCKKSRIDLQTSWEDLSSKDQESIWRGDKNFHGVMGFFKKLESKKYKMHVRVFLARYKNPVLCEICQGARLNPDVQQVLIGTKSISDMCSLTVDDLLQFLLQYKMSKSESELCEEILRQIVSRLEFLQDVGVGYLTLDRPSKTLSGGEYQRIRLSSQLGMGLSQTLYVLDEPTVGLHPRDNDKLIGIVKKLRDLGNTLVVVEHDHDMILNSNYVIEIGPGSGRFGGDIIYSGARDDFFQFESSNTLGYLFPKPSALLNRTVRPVDLKKYRYKLKLSGCRGNNLKNVRLTLPLNRLVTITGVSGSGKSSLISHILYPAVAKALGIEHKRSLPYDEIQGIESLKNVLHIDQSPIGRTSRSNLMTYLKIYDSIRNLLASTEEAQVAGYTPGTFSLNVPGGRCPSCEGLGFEVVDMVFMDDIHIPCDACDGKKFRDEILEIRFMGKNILDISNMTVEEAIDFFVSSPKIRRPLFLLGEIGLGYIALGQNASTFSGGESQRLKMARELNCAQNQPTLYILDEPTTGLHFREVHLLLHVLNRLVDTGNSVVLIEHNLEVIRNSDYIVDMGPEAGEKGGRIIACGTPEEIMRKKNNYTGIYLKKFVNNVRLRGPVWAKEGSSKELR